MTGDCSVFESKIALPQASGSERSPAWSTRPVIDPLLNLTQINTQYLATPYHELIMVQADHVHGPIPGPRVTIGPGSAQHEACGQFPAWPGVCLMITWCISGSAGPSGRRRAGAGTSFWVIGVASGLIRLSSSWASLNEPA